MKTTKQIILCLPMLLSVGVWGQTKITTTDTVFVKSKRLFNRAIKDVIPPNSPSGRCFSYTIKNQGGTTPNGGFWVSMFRKELKLTVLNGWNLRPLNLANNIQIVSSGRIGNTYTYILESSIGGTFELPLVLQNQSDYPCYGVIPISFITISKKSDNYPRKP
ncbi:hypothetical protein [Chryseobacterium sp. EO14]|uniref:hypothetical protein n=1 Tax=Chryseobacterium sp. EO14 TaxID=2950551 RepID=UPI00210DBB51|nr:hypothetical protein [Chryseobacterium sp. EO14]MCQ4141623.1 hypothetical protein [Chryseobacterium sp. EO14]